MNAILNTLPADFEVPPDLVEARELLELAQQDHTEAIERANGLSAEIDRQTQAAADARRAYGANPTTANHKAMLGAEQLVSDLTAQHEASLEAVEELTAPLVAARQHLATVEAEVLAAYRTEVESAKKAQAKDIAAALREIAILLNHDHALVPFVRAELDDLTKAALDAITRRAH